MTKELHEATVIKVRLKDIIIFLISLSTVIGGAITISYNLLDSYIERKVDKEIFAITKEIIEEKIERQSEIIEDYKKDLNSNSSNVENLTYQLLEIKKHSKKEYSNNQSPIINQPHAPNLE